MFLLPLLACRPTAALPKPAPLDEPILVDDSDFVGAADLDGDGADELLTVSGGSLHWLDQSGELGGGVQAVAHGDLDGDGDEEFVIATGTSREERGAPARVWVVDGRGLELLWERAGARTQTPTLAVIDGRIWICTYLDGLKVEAGWLDEGGLDVQSTGHLAEAQLPIEGGVVMARVYGEEPRSPGDLRRMVGEEAIPLPSFRGARSMTMADMDGDGSPELLVGDGWHSDYGKVADGRVTLLRGPDWTRGGTLAHFSTDYSARSIEVLDGAVLVVGSKRAHLLRNDGLGWIDDDLGEAPGNAVFVRTPEGPAVLVAGHPGRLHRF